jgi:2-(1,2-epoxy-1,2-dihydrophenyl)acetyl-CoA isomerase
VETLLHDLDDGVLTLTLNRPESLNAFNRDLLGRLTDALTGDARRPEVRTVVITGAGRGFCTGQDLAEEDREGTIAEAVTRRYNPLIAAVTGLEKPVIAAVNGPAAGAGLALALACDLRIAAAEAVFVTAFTRIGLAADSGICYFLPRLVGLAKAFELLAFSPRIDAAEALRLGLVNRVVPGEALRDEVRSLALELARGPTRALGLVKRGLRFGSHATLEETLLLEAQLQEEASRTEDYREGVRAFREKRQPRFQGM